MKPYQLLKRPDLPGLLRGWHTHLSEKRRGDRARLARAVDPGAVVFVPAFHELLAKLGAAKDESVREGFAVWAALAARVRTPLEGKSLATQMGARKRGSDSAVVSELRFRRLLEAEEPAQLLIRLRRILDQLGRSADLLSLAQACLDWGPRLKRQWAYDYYQVTANPEPEKE